MGTGNLRKFAPRLEEIEEEEGKERKTANSSPVDEEEEEEEGKGMMGSFHSSASSGSSTLDMMGRVVREGSGKEERRGRSKHQVFILVHHHFETNIVVFRVWTRASQRDLSQA